MRNRKTGRRLWACLPALLVALLSQWPVFAAEPVAAAGKPADFRSQNFLVHTDVPVVNTNDLEHRAAWSRCVGSLCVGEHEEPALLRLCFSLQEAFAGAFEERFFQPTPSALNTASVASA